MAILHSNGILLVSSIPTHTPVAGQAKFARLQDSLTIFYYNGSGWITVRLDSPESFTGGIIADNSTIGEALQSLENAIQGINQDGNHTFITREDDLTTTDEDESSKEDVPPTAEEIPGPINGDTADISLSHGKIEKWIYTSGSWSKSFTINYKDITNLEYVPSSADGKITNTNSNDEVILPPVSDSAAGLMLPTQKTALTSAFDKAHTHGSTASIKHDKTSGVVRHTLAISAAQTRATVTIEADGLRVVVDDFEDSKPSTYISRAAAVESLGANKRFIYSKTNLDGAIEGSVAWT
jgi:hypothetical protein